MACTFCDKLARQALKGPDALVETSSAALDEKDIVPFQRMMPMIFGSIKSLAGLLQQMDICRL